MADIIYAKYSNDRNPQYAILTTIETDNGNKWVCKKAMFPEAEEHVQALVKYREKLEKQYAKSGFRFLEGAIEGDSIRFPFVQGQALSEKIIGFFQIGEQEKAYELIKTFAQKLCLPESLHKFKKTDKFSEIFGDMVFEQELDAMDFCDIDLICENIFLEQEWVVIDYEWTFEFDIPVNYVLYRAIYYLFKENDWGIRTNKVYEMLGIQEKEILMYEQMELNFQSYIGNTSLPLYKLRDSIGMPLINVGEAAEFYKDYQYRGKIQVYYNQGKGYFENESVYLENKYDKEGRFSIEIQVDKDTKELRLDPMNGQGIVLLSRVENQNGEPLNYYHNGKSIGENLICFDEYDTQIYIMLPEDKNNKKIYVDGVMEFGNRDIEEYLCSGVSKYEDTILDCQNENMQLEKEKNMLEEENARLEQQIKSMESTKVWRLYEKYRKLVKKR